MTPTEPAQPPEPASPAPAPTAKSNILPSGEEILAKLKEAGQVIPENEQRAILEISDDEAMAKFLAANIGETVNPDEMTANSVFSGWLMDKLNIPPMALTLQFDNLGQCGRAIEFCTQELAKPNLTPEQRNNAIKTMVEALKQRGYMIKTVLQMAQTLKPPKGKAGPRNAPPDTLTKPPSVVVNIANQVQVPTDKTKDARQPTFDAK